jgi:hypothetical protein
MHTIRFMTAPPTRAGRGTLGLIILDVNQLGPTGQLAYWQTGQKPERFLFWPVGQSANSPLQ